MIGGWSDSGDYPVSALCSRIYSRSADRPVCPRSPVAEDESQPSCYSLASSYQKAYFDLVVRGDTSYDSVRQVIPIRKSLTGLIGIDKWISLTVRGSPISTTLHREMTILVLVIAASLRSIRDVAPDMYLPWYLSV
jgi:hypothetical protein